MFRSLWLLLFTVLLTGLTGQSRAATVNFNGNGKAPDNCTLSGSTYTCSTAFIGANDTASIASGVTVTVDGAIQLGYFQGIKMTGTARLQTTGANGIDFSGAQVASIDVAGGTIQAGNFVRDANNNLSGGGTFLISNGQSVTATVLGNTVSTSGSSATIKGSIAAFTVSLGSRATVTGDIYCNTFSASDSNTINGAITAQGTVALGSYTTVGGNISGTKITTGAPVNITGTVKATTSFSLESGSSVTGDIVSPTVTLLAANSKIKGNISASNTLTLGSGTNITGNIDGGAMTMQASGVVINGNATMKGNVSMESGSVINGDLVAARVVTQSQGANINGNAAVNYIYIDWYNTVSKVITCTGPGAVGCSCVEKPTGYVYNPTCGASASAPHHIQITHGGSALTCQPQTVTVTACANAACTAPHYSASVKTTLQPGGGEFTISGGTNTAATVSRSTAGTATLSASGGTNASTCVNTTAGSTSCDMVFSDSGLTLSVPDHVSMTTASVTLQALKSAPAPNAGKTCVPLVANTTATVNFSCSYLNPANATKLPLALKNQDATSYTSISCSSGSTGVPLKFDANGLATASLQYAEVGSLGLSASYLSGASGASTPTATAFTVAPKEFVLSAKRKASTTLLAGYFEKAGTPFTLTVEARNAAGNVVTNFGRENTPENVFLAVKVTEPLTGGTGELLGTRGAITAGVSTSDVRFSETGKVEVTAQLVRTSRNYMDNATTGFATQGKLVLGRFAPQYYETVLVDKRHLACSGVPGINRPCPDQNGVFTHARQGFFVQVLAYNGKDVPTLSQNYTGAWAAPVTIEAWSATASGGKALASTGSLAWQVPTATRFAFTQGTGALADEVNNLPAFSFNTPYPARNLPATVYLRATDGNGVSSDHGTTSVEAQMTFVSGQLALANVYGAQNAVTPVAASAQYYLAKGYVNNPLVDVTSVPFGAFPTFRNCTRALDAGNGACPAGLRVDDSSKTLGLTKGKGTFTIAPPKPALSGTGTAEVSLGELIPYLPSTTGKATFGVYRSGPVIYTRELY